MKKTLKFLLHRVFIVVLLMVIQILLLIGVALRFNEFFVVFYSGGTMLAALLVLHVLNSRSNPAYKIAWIVPILIFPVFGGLMYLIFGNIKLKKSHREKLFEVKLKTQTTLTSNHDITHIQMENQNAQTQAHYIQRCSLIPPYTNTYTKYLTLGEIKFEHMKQEIEKAEKYIFLEYFIIEQGVMWDTLLEILVRKAARGVDVRLIYDDLGCILTLPYKYNKKLESMGIKCCVFNPFTPVLSASFNNRDHRKIAIIDGIVGFTGGINLADEYINGFVKHGHWKDTAIMVKGDAAWGLTLMFLYMWDSLRAEEKDYDYYKPIKTLVEHATGYVQPYSDIPMDEDAVGENICLNLIYKANHYVYITTPYLIIDNELMTALTTAAKSGVDIRIITPHIPDKWYVHAVTKSNYQQLVESGVKIYEYTPGFIHAKSFVVDDLFATVGTVNLDYRSLYLHFECGVWLHSTDSIKEIYDDFMKTLEVCELITLEHCQNISRLQKFGWSLLSVFSPLM